MVDIKNLCVFLVKAKKSTYANASSEKIRESDRSTTIVFEEGDWKYSDNYFGWEPYGGREVVFFKGVPAYIMTYYGWVDEKVESAGEMYQVLQQALLRIPETKPYRGPEEYVQWDYMYSNSFSGEVDNFSGEEIIEYKGEELYRAKYMGWFVDQRG